MLYDMTVCSVTCLVRQTYLDRGFPPSEMLRCVGLFLITDVSAQSVDPTLTYRLSRNVGNQPPTYSA